jgi:hypothetical protein
MFSILYAGKHGPSVESDNPKIDAYKQASYIQNILGSPYSLTSHDDGCFTVVGGGAAPITFEPMGTAGRA